MPLTKLDFRPGINRESTTYTNEGGFYSCDKIRFSSGRPQKLGGWLNQSYSYTFNGKATALWNWVPSTGANLLAVGTNQKYYIENGGEYHNITPVRATSTINNNPFSVTNASKVVTVTDTAHGAKVNDYVTFSGATAAGGLTLNGEFEVVRVIDGDTYVIVSSTAASSTTTGGGAAVVATYQLASGSSVATTGIGWGASAWGAGGWGSAASTIIQLRLWSQDLYENDLIFAPRGGEIYYWALDTSTYPAALPLSTVADTQVKFTAYAAVAAAAPATTIYVDDASGITSGSVVTGTNIPTGTYVTAAYANGTAVTLSAAVTGAGVALGATLTFGYAGQHVPNKVEHVVASDTSHFTIAFGSNPYSPVDFNTTYDPLLVRWSDQDNPFEWVPSTTNQAGELHLSNGSYLVTAIDARDEILVWSDSAMFRMQYVGPPYVWAFNLINSNVSIASPNAVVSVNTQVFWMGVDKFYTYAGRLEVLSCTIQQYVFGNLNRNQLFQVTSGVNESWNEVWWFYPSADSQVNDSYVVYNYIEQVWFYGTLNRSAWLDSPLRQYPMGAFSVQNSYLDTSLTSSATMVALMNGASYPASGTITIDSENITYTGISGNLLTGCTRGAESTTAATHAQYAPVTYKTANQVMYHEYGNDDQSEPTARPIEAYIESADFDIGDGHNFGFVWRILPDLSFTGSSESETPPKVYLTVKARQNSGASYNSDGSPVVTRTATVPVEQYTGQVYTRIRGRQMAFRIESEDLGVAWKLGVPRIDIRPDGRR